MCIFLIQMTFWLKISLQLGQQGHGIVIKGNSGSLLPFMTMPWPCWPSWSDAMAQIDADDLTLLLHCLRHSLPVQEGIRVYVFGSRATYKARPYSDLDLALEHPDHPL